ncbi:hypothetical protein CRG98_004411 [Punica granatum]|uniref:Uncharacterized protein n=1 Tax=Punica granatum TaxID=22663 RepID=A0A2I0L3A4_PUNGR|nr:hypothetical protein CRG98_004411 [Punica granatum]
MELFFLSVYPSDIMEHLDFLHIALCSSSNAIVLSISFLKYLSLSSLSAPHFGQLALDTERLDKALITIQGRADGGERSDMGARTTEEKQGPLERHRREIRRTDEQRTPKTAEAGTVALFIDGSPKHTFLNGPPGRPDPRTDKQHPKTGLYTPEGHPDHGTGVRLCFGAHLGLSSGSQPGENAPFSIETWPETLLMNRQCTKSAPINPEDLKA